MLTLRNPTPVAPFLISNIVSMLPAGAKPTALLAFSPTMITFDGTVTFLPMP